MMKLYAKMFALTEESISAKAIARLRWLTFGSLSYVPLIAFFILKGLPSGYAAVLFMVVFLFSSILGLSVLSSRIVNRVWSPDKYLDEWEIDLKRKAMATAFMAVMYFAMAMGVVWTVCYYYFPSFLIENSKTLPLLMILLFIGTGLYTQIFAQLSLIEPMEEDELEGPKYIVTSSRSILGIIALCLVLLSSALFISGYYSGHREHVIVHNAAQEVCGDTEVATHKKTGTIIDVTCKGSDAVIQLDSETLKPI